MSWYPGSGPSSKGPPVPLPDLLRDILVCTACHGDLDETATELVCRSCGRRYPIEDGIPNMLLEAARLPGPGDGSAGSPA